MTRLALALLILVVLVAPAAALEAFPGETELDNEWFTIVDETGDPLVATGISLSPGDRYITADDREYEVTRLEGRVAYTRFVAALPPWREATGLWAWLTGQSVPAQGGERPLVAIYHSHSDESYLPSDGVSSTDGNGGIYQVGAALRRAMEAKGLRVEHEQANHNPRDARAYERSRRTASGLMRQRPALLLDVHRDSGPAEAYEANVRGRDVTQLLLVVGSQNPNMQANLSFARKIKSITNRTSPGLVRGIMVARGRYNQDLGPRAALIEVGAHTNRREDAERAMALFADAVPGILGVAGAGGEAAGAWRALAWILALTVVGGSAYLVVASGGWRQAWDRLRHFADRELADIVGARRGPRGGRDGDSG